MKTKIGVFGSAFNPPHSGHSDVLEQVCEDFDEIILIPSFRHAFNKKMVPYQHRLMMTGLLAQSFNDLHSVEDNRAAITVSTIERELGNNNSRAVYTFDILSELENRLHRARQQASLTFIIGPDNAIESVWKKFYKADEIQKRWAIKIAAERLPIHSHLIRESLSQNQDKVSTCSPKFDKYLNKNIAQYIVRNKLYGVKE